MILTRHRIMTALLLGAASLCLASAGTQAQAPVESADPQPILTGPAPVLEIETLSLHPEVEKAVIAARESEARARQKSAEARAAKDRAEAASRRALEASGKAKAGLDGHAVQDFAGNGRYEGEFTDGVRKGAGLFISADGERFAGEWAANSRSGFGISTARSGVTFAGTWRNGNPCGAGVVTWPNGDRYEGEYCNSRINGFGVFISGERTNYIRENAGQWVEDKQAGPGVRHWTHGGRSEGVWRDGKLNGYGAEYGLTGTVATVIGVPQQGIFAAHRLVTALVPAPPEFAVSGDPGGASANSMPVFVPPTTPAAPLQARIDNPVPVFRRSLDALRLHPQVATALRSARDAETQARENAAAAREAKTRAGAAALRAREASERAYAKTAGHAVQAFPSLGSYEGQLADKMRHGAGVFTGADGERFEGDWDKDIRHGYGVAVFATGIRYEGSWRNGGACGLGVVTWPDGNRYEGEYCLGQMSGLGVFVSSAGKVDRENAGRWANSKQTGFGVRIYRDDTRWEGAWLDGKLQGAGAKLLAQGVEQGVFEEDELRTRLAP